MVGSLGTFTVLYDHSKVAEMEGSGSKWSRLGSGGVPPPRARP